MAKRRRKQARRSRAAPRAAKKSSSKSCGGPWAWVWLLLGLALLLRDVGMMNLLGNASWSSLVLTLLGLQWVAN